VGDSAGRPVAPGGRVLAHHLTLRQLAPLFGVSKSAAGRIVGHLGPRLALKPRRRFRKDTVLIVDGPLVPTRDHTVAERSKNYRYSTNHQVVIDADTRRVVVVGRPLPGNRNDYKAWALSGAEEAVGRTTVIADGGYRGTGLIIPHRRERGQNELPAWKEEHNTSHRQVRARVEHAFARMKTWTSRLDGLRRHQPAVWRPSTTSSSGAVLRQWTMTSAPLNLGLELQCRRRQHR
jgi:hypothetical protein